MLTNQEPEELLDHASYLRDELNALRDVIPAVPYKEKPMGESSILEMLMMIDQAQVTWFSAVIENKFFDTKSLPNEANDEPEPDEVISRTRQNRSSLLEILNKMPEENWHRPVSMDGNETTIYNLLHELIRFERNKLKEIAERVLVIDAARSIPRSPGT